MSVVIPKQFTDSIDFPNGRGYTPCTAEYIETKEKRDAIYVPGDGRTLDDLSPEEYQAYSELDNKLMQLQLSGHLGQSVRFL